MKYTLWGRVFFRKNWTKQVQYGVQGQTMNQNETRTTDGSHAHLDDVWYDVEVTDRLGRPVDATDRSLAAGSRDGVAFGFAVRAGLMARIADSLTRDKPPADRLPQRMDLGGRPAYRLVTTEAFGPMAHVRDWTLQQLGVTSDSLAGAQLTDFFSTDGFQRMSRV
ncbi:hypothetical protein NGM37_10450, partial [Streptomyces sp. TRM76130]|nr:hypothetical protein [Streptomyces sp. TRM76130]